MSGETSTLLRAGPRGLPFRAEPPFAQRARLDENEAGADVVTGATGAGRIRNTCLSALTVCMARYGSFMNVAAQRWPFSAGRSTAWPGGTLATKVRSPFGSTVYSRAW